ncbi:MAG: hypothetical protein K2L12_08505 [Clostridia bacterium]|nr:hypothetical protein [Clostridia bacterium]
MEKDLKYKQIEQVLKDVYEDKISDDTFNPFAEDLYDSVFLCEYDLEDIFAIVFTYEAEIELEFSEVYYVFCQLIDLLEINEINARRLYKSFMDEFDCLETFVKLYNECSEYLSKIELAKAKEKAFGTFDRLTLELYGITEEE